jgi:copper chaperone
VRVIYRLSSCIDIRLSINFKEALGMASKTFKVPNISCGHCVMTIQREVGELNGVTSVKADEASKMVTVEWNEPPAKWDSIRDLLEEINYPAES